jgi:hypothetical protein
VDDAALVFPPFHGQAIERGSTLHPFSGDGLTSCPIHLPPEPFALQFLPFPNQALISVAQPDIMVMHKHLGKDRWL